MAIDVRSVARYLDGIPWRYEMVDSSRILSGLRCEVPFYHYTVPLEFRVGQHWVAVRAFVQRHVPNEQRAAVLSLLSAINARAHQMRAFLVEDCAIVQVDVPAARCGRQEFLEALFAVCRQASDVGLELAVMAMSPSVAGLYASVDARRLASSTVGASAAIDEALLDFELSANRLPD